MFHRTDSHTSVIWGLLRGRGTPRSRSAIGLASAPSTRSGRSPKGLPISSNGILPPRWNGAFSAPSIACQGAIRLASDQRSHVGRDRKDPAVDDKQHTAASSAQRVKRPALCLHIALQSDLRPTRESQIGPDRKDPTVNDKRHIRPPHRHGESRTLPCLHATLQSNLRPTGGISIGQITGSQPSTANSEQPPRRHGDLLHACNNPRPTGLNVGPRRGLGDHARAWPSLKGHSTGQATSLVAVCLVGLGLPEDLAAYAVSRGGSPSHQLPGWQVGPWRGHPP